MDETKKAPDYYRLEVSEALKDLSASNDGLSSNEAKKRLESYGSNKLAEVYKESLVIKYLRQFKDLIIILLLISSAISYGLDDTKTAVALLIIVFLNTFLGFRQEYQAEKTMESLEKLVVPIAKAKRDGKLLEISSQELVPGDIVYVEGGDSVPADVRLIEISELATNDFALTGESDPVHKNIHAINNEVPIGDRHNLVFMGTTIAMGHGLGIVVGTGMNTELGRIASMSAETKHDDSPLQKEMNNVAQKVTWATVAIFCLLLLISIRTDLGSKEAFLFAVAVAASLVPQGLPAAISTVLAQAAKKMADARALVKKLSAVETLGATSVICTDKTGTLTKNEMTVEQIVIGSKTYQVTGTGYEANGEIIDSNKKPLGAEILKDLELFLVTGVMSSNARIGAPDDEHATWYCLGDPTEGSLITLAHKAKVDTDKLETDYKELKQFSFDSGRKMMSSIRPWGFAGQQSKQNYVFVKGAPESILSKCTEIWNHGHTRKITDKDKKQLLNKNQELAADAMRNLAFAYKALPSGTKVDNLTMEEAESDLILLGMVSMLDPLREEVIDAMKAAHAAHIKVSVVTGDNAETAKAIAAKSGLANGGHELTLVTGQELQELSDKEVIQLVKRGSIIFSRVSPEDKLRIVGLVKDSGEVVAVTGDGINDAPALKRADIGVAMGKTGTDVAKQSAEIVLLDDSFDTLVHAIQQGRTIYQNIKKITLVIFVANGSELVINLASLLGASIISTPLMITVMLILAIDLIAELFPVIALGWDKAEGVVMTEQPRNPKDHILNRQNIIKVGLIGSLIGILSIANFYFFFYRNGISPEGIVNGTPMALKASTLVYVTIMVCQLTNILYMRSSKGLFTRYQLHNKKLFFAYVLSLICILNIVYNPWLQPYFRSSSLSLADWGTAIGAAVVFVICREFVRLFNKPKTQAKSAAANAT